MATALSILISDTHGCVIFRRLSIAPVFGQLREDFQLNHLGLVAARFADPIVSLQPCQFARNRHQSIIMKVDTPSPDFREQVHNLDR